MTPNRSKGKRAREEDTPSAGGSAPREEERRESGVGRSGVRGRRIRRRLAATGRYIGAARLAGNACPIMPAMHGAQRQIALRCNGGRAGAEQGKENGLHLREMEPMIGNPIERVAARREEDCAWPRPMAREEGFAKDQLTRDRSSREEEEGDDVSATPPIWSMPGHAARGRVTCQPCVERRRDSKGPA